MPPVEEVGKVGLSPGRVVMSRMDHIDRARCDRAWLKAIAEMGCYLAYDHFGKEVSHYPSSIGGDRLEMLTDAGRTRQILWLLEQGYGRQVLLSQDVAIKVKLVRYGGFGYRHVLRRIVPGLRKLGLSEKDIWMLIAENPARAVTFA